ncbi:TIGR04255 family protein [Porticoccaceae bacterium]|nr:TIGR04255 family protein [Porticoccaceae bacterium]MDA8788760.1 TIGR04255 family protein [Porticoccaceae bacterium]MDB2343260.1 TIGR04255 family protein [Porticoccaceae bacterium]MDB2634084.1 TIGR04255 family protein [Porticoccaceae bacterium]MDB2663919.1 TIGR04255 family protein [Porticoccaceae bacterium]
MKKTLTSPPLVHAVLDLRFSEIPSLNPIDTDPLKKLHERMITEGFQEKIESEAMIIDVTFDPDRQKMNQNRINKKRTLFRAAGETDIVEIREESIILKTTNYATFGEFYGRFHRVLEGCLDNLNGLRGALLKSIGLRYVNVIAPTNQNSLSDLVSAEVLPASLSMINDGNHVQGATFKVVETKGRQILTVNFEELLARDNKVSKILPDNLMEPDTNCGLFIAGHPDWLKVTSKTYGLLDVDHTHHFQNSPLFDVDKINLAAEQLYQHARDVFWKTISKQAQQTWGVQDVEEY